MFCCPKFSFYKYGLRKIQSAFLYMQQKLPKVYLVFFDRQNKWRFSRYTLSYLYGIFLAYVFWEFLLYDLGFPIDILYGSLIFFILLLGLGFTFSKRIRCIVILICFEFWGKSGRSFLRAVIFALIISGPIRNMASNGKETIRVFSCSALLTYNLSKTRFDLMSRPFVNAIVGMKKNVSNVKESFKAIESVVEPIVEEIELPDKNNDTSGVHSKRNNDHAPLTSDDHLESADHYQEQYSKKIERRCEAQLKKGEAKCKKAFGEAYNRCYEKLPALINTLFCWPMKITVVCNIKLYTFSLRGRGVCDPTGVVDERLGENYYNLKGSENKIMANLSSVKLKYQVISPKEIPGVKGIDETRKELTGQFLKSKSMFDFFMKIIKRILAFIFIKVILHSVRYTKEYLNNIEADNIYVTDYFKRIDARRKESGKKSLLPLKKDQQVKNVDYVYCDFKIESREIIDPTDFRQSKSEAKGMMVFILKLFLELITALIFLLIDHIIYVLLDIVRANALIEYVQEGEHMLKVHVNGTGIVANLIRATLKGFNTHETINVKLTNEQCLPQPSHLPILFYIKFLMLYITLILLICNQRIIFRLRHVICSYFYRKQEKRRVLHLYNKLLKRRKHLFVAMQEVVRVEIEKHRIQHRLNIFVMLRMKCPSIFGWLRMLPVGRRVCLICSEPELKKYDPSRPYNFANCKNRGCYFTYCEECWLESGEECLACKLKREKSSSPISEEDY